MIRVVSLTVVHYGADYLKEGLQSVHDSVDAQYVLYTPVGSFGHRTDLVCPDTREQLAQLAIEGAGSKLRWHEGTYTAEWQHRDKIYELEPDADVILIVDADEVWQEGLAEDVVKHFEKTKHRTVRILTSHFWRSFKRGIINDGMHAEHGHAPKMSNAEDNKRHPLESDKRILHFGYAQRLEVMYYKQFTHGHLPEWRKDWYETKVVPNAQADVHPCIWGCWNPEAVDAYALGLPEWMKAHPYADLEVIP
jgi:hypothetical protein